MPKQETESLMQAAKQRDSTGVYRFASAIPVTLTSNNAGVWTTASNGRRVWRLGVSSPGALSLNLGFQRYRMPAGGRMVIFPQGSDALSPATRAFTDRDNEEHGQLWTPLFDGSELVIEVDVPADKEKELDIALTRVNHGFRRIAKVSEKTAEKIGDSATGGCEIDVACSAATLPGLGALIDAQRDQISAVGAFTLNGIDTCSGALINNTAGDGRPFFLTANHCGITTGNAPSMVVYWNFQNSSCRTPGCCGSDKAGDGSLSQFNTGAIFRAAYAPSDFALVELDDPVDPVAKAFFAGWDRSGAQATSSTCIHHPALAEKRISFSFGTTTTTGWGGTSSPGDSSHARVYWSNGVTEPGSSGSPLFDQNLRIIGQLHGGDSDCDGTGSDWFGRISKSWDGGGTDSTRLKNWLDPLTTAPATLNGRRPSAMLTIADASVVEGNSGSSTITFIVTLEPTSTQTVTVNYAALADIASIPADLPAASGVVTFAPGQTSQTISIAVNGDTASETDERFFVQLSNATNAGIYRVQANGIISNDDYLPPVIDSPLTASTFVGRPFSYNIHGTNTPRTFSLAGTPPSGMTVNSSTGVITWTPPTAGTFNVQIVAANPAGSDTKTLQIQAAFGAVDLSDGLPPVADQGTLAASVAFAVCYYYKTFQEGKEHNWSLTDPAHQFSPTFTLNQSNQAYYTVGISELMDIVAEHGCAPLSLAPYTPQDISTWPTYEASLAALPYRSSGSHALGGGGTPEIIDRMRAHLESGDICVFEFDRWRADPNAKGTFELLGVGNDHYDLPLASERTSDGLQAVAVVGYDDSQFGGRGGFKVVASFGTNWGGQGFAWMSYDFVKIFGYGVYVIEDRIGYAPTATARVAFSHSYLSYDGIIATLGTGPETNPTWSKEIISGASIRRDGFSADMAFDLTEIAGYLPPSPSQKWWLRIYDGSREDSTFLTRFDITAGATTFSSAAYMPLTGSMRSGDTLRAVLPAGANTSSQYFVNDAFTTGDVYAAAPGSDLNDGLSPATPKATIQSVVDTYTLKAGDTIWVDAGIYPDPVVIDHMDRGAAGNPVRFVGAIRPNGEHATFLDRSAVTTGDVVLVNDNGKFITFENLWIKGGQTGFYHEADWNYGDEEVTLRNVRISGSSGSACQFIESAGVVMDNCLLHEFGSTGVQAIYSALTFKTSTIAAPSGIGCFYLASSSSDYASNAYLTLSHSIVTGQRTTSSLSLISLGSYSYVTSAKNNILHAANGATIGLTPDATNVQADPLFANPAAGDYHEQSIAGRWDPAANAGEGAWVTDVTSSPAIDLADPAAGAGLEPAPNGGRMNAGAFGGTAFASKSPAARLLTMGSPNGGESWQGLREVTWNVFGSGWQSGETVRLEYWNGAAWVLLAADAAEIAYEAGVYVWNTNAPGIVPGNGFRVRVVANVDNTVSDESNGAFSVVAGGRLFFCNDASTVNDVYCTAVGIDTNDGLTPSAPKASLQAVFSSYDLEPGDAVYVDTGTYSLAAGISAGSDDGGSSNGRVYLYGSSRGTTFQCQSSTLTALTIPGSFVTVESLRFTGGSGINVSGSYGVIRRNVCTGPGGTGISISCGSFGRVENNLCVMNGLGISLGSDSTARNNTVDSGGSGISAQNSNTKLFNNIVRAAGAAKYCVYTGGSGWGGASDWNSFQASGGALIGQNGTIGYGSLADWRRATGFDLHSLTSDPQFANAAGGDYHLKSSGGRWDPVGGVFVTDAVDSPCLDAGNPQDAVGAEPAPNGGRINLGAYGGTAEASKSPTGRALTLLRPNGGEVWVGIQNIAWLASGQGWNIGETARLEYSANGGSTWNLIAGAAALPFSSGQFAWNTSGLVPGHAYLVRVLSNANPSVLDVSDAVFATHNGVVSFYVNDAATTNDVYCTAAGNSANDGLTPATPKDSLQAIFDAYDLEPGDAVYVDTGTYNLTTGVTLGADDGGGASGQIYITGSSFGSTLACQSSGVTALAVPVSYVSITGLRCTGGSGINATGSNVRVLNNVCIGPGTSGTGIAVASSSVIENNICTMHGLGLSLGQDSTARNNTIYSGGNGVFASEGLYTPQGRSIRIQNNIIRADGGGKYCVYDSWNSANADFNVFQYSGGAIMAQRNESGFTKSYNTLLEWRNRTGFDQHSLTSDPQFANAAGGDFHLKSTGGRWDPVGGVFVADALDSPCLDAGNPQDAVGAEPAPNGGRINLGAYGGTAEASKSPAGRTLTLITPNGAEVWIASQTVRWTAAGEGWAGGDTVQLEYSANGGTSWNALAGATSLPYTAGQFVWSTQGLAPGHAYLIRITSNANPAVFDISDATFVTHNGVLSFYVNDAATVNDLYCSAAGGTANDGLTPATPKSSLQAIFDAYDLEPGDVVYVDTGTYNLAATIVMPQADGGAAGTPVKIIGSGLKGTILNRGASNARCLEVHAPYTWIEGLTCTGGSQGISINVDTATNCTITRNVARNNSGSGIEIKSYNYGGGGRHIITNNLVYQNGGGIYLQGSNYSNTGSFEVRQNTIIGGGIIVLGATKGSTVMGNIVSATSSAQQCIYHSDAIGTCDYNDFQVSGGAAIGKVSSTSYPTLWAWQSATGFDLHSLNADPQFANAAGGDFHLKSTGGRWDPVGGVFVTDAVDSPCLDAGNPLDAVGAEPVPNGGRINLGAYGGTSEASKSPQGRLLSLVAPIGGESWSGYRTVRWLAAGQGWQQADTVTVQYSTDSGANWQNLPGWSGLSALGNKISLNFSVLTPGNHYRVRVVFDGNPLINAASSADFILQAGGVYYVNDGSTTGDSFTTASGSDANDGLTPATPKATLEAILSAYDLGPNDMVLMDAGNYSPAAAINISAEDGGSSAGMVRIRGVKGKTVINQGINLAASFVSLEDLWIRAAANGVYVTSGSCAVQGCQISECSGAAIYVWQADGTVIQNNTILHSGTDGAIYLRAYYYQGYYGLVATIRNNTIVTTGATGVYARVSSGPVITNNIFSVKGAGRYAIDASPRYDSITLTSDYNVLHVTNGAQIGNYYDQFQTASLDQWRALIGWELHSIAADPQFANAAGGDYHVKSRGGRFDPSLGLPASNPSAWVIDATTSPAVDGGDPTSPVGAETAFNGGIINAGADGGTEEASRSVNAGRNIEIVYPSGGEALAGYARVEWRTSGADWQGGDTIRLEASADGGGTWQSVNGAAALPWTATQYYWDTNAVSNGYGYCLRFVHVQTAAAVGVPTPLFAISNEAGADWNLYVAPNGVDDAFHGTPAMPFKTIGYAIDAAQGQTGTHVNIFVAAGTYTERVTLKSYVNLMGGYSAVDWTRNITANVTTLDAQGSGSVVTGASNSLIEGFTITGGNTSNGGGVSCSVPSFVVRYCRIVNNTATSSGGGIYASDDIIVDSCVIAGNQALYGDGLHIGYSTTQVRNCTVINNGGYGIYGFGTAAQIANCIVWNNGDDLYNVTATYSNIEDLDTGTGIIHQNPLLDANFRLTANSPCINKGANLEAYQLWLDLDGQPRIRHGVVDMGADEFDQLVAFPLAVTINEDTPVAGSLTGSDVNGGTITFAKVADPTKGVAVVNPDGTYTYTPNLNANGADSFTFKVNNGVTDSNEATVSITITPVNDAPAVTDIADVTINEDTNTGVIPFTTGDAETAVASLTVTRSSSNTTLVPLANVVLGGSGANRTITVTPVANLSGTTTITVNVSDGTLTTSDTFVVTVNAVNDAPTISNIIDRSINEDANTGAVAFTVGDVETPVASLTLAGSSSNQALVPDANIVFGGTGASRTVTVTPLPNQNGTATITVTVSDEAASTSDTFLLTVNAVNDAPTISNIADLGVSEDTSTGPLAFTIDDIDTALASLSVTRSSSNTTLIPTANIVLGGTGASRTVTVTPAANLSGTATITVTVSDGFLSASDTFLVTVSAVNDAPTITDITDRSVNEDANTGAVAFTIGDLETATTSLNVSGSSSNQALVPDANIVFGGTGASRTVTVTPLANQNGTATITVTVSDGVASASDTFQLTVNTVNDAPTISNILDLAINEDATTGALAFTIGDIETAADSLIVTRSSSNTTLVPTANIVLAGTGANRTVTVTPSANLSGTATITVTVSDGFLSAIDTFLVTVSAVNDSPTISDIADLAINEDASTGALAFTIGDVETAATSLTVTRSSSDTTLIPTANIVLGGTGASRTVTVTPAANLSGTATITVTVSDGVASTSDTFLVTVNAVNDAPLFTKGANQTVNEDAAPQSVTAWATGISAGPSETSQAVDFILSSNNPSLFSSAPAISSSGTLTFTPAPNANGSATVTVQIHDDGGTASGGINLSSTQTFTITVNPVNDTPVISNIVNQIINNAGSTGAVAFTVTDIETPASSLTVAGSSSNTILVPNANVIFGGSGSSRTVTVLNTPSQTGTATITVMVSDGVLSASDTFDVTVNAPEIGVEQPAGTSIADGGSKSFGFVALGGSNALSFIIKNTGNADLTGLGITIDGTNAADFTVTTSPVAPVSGPTGSTTFTVRFAPASVGAKTGALHIASNDADESPYDITLTGTGMSAELSALVPGSGSLSPVFAAATTDYTVSVPTATTSITMKPTLVDASATVKVNGATVASGVASAPISLNMGTNVINVVVTAQDGTTTKTYNVTVRRGDTKAQITSPANGSALTSTSLPLVWNAGVGVTGYALWVGTSAGGYDLYAGLETGTSRTVSVPADRRIHVTLWSLISGSYQGNYYVFDPVPSAKATLITPADGSTLASGTLTLNWNAGVGVSSYALWLGSSPGTYDLGAASAGMATAWTFTGVPQDGGPVYLTLWSLINGAYQSNSYWFTTALPVSGNRAAILTSPANATALSSASLDLAWDAGVGAASYALWVGSTANGYDLYAALEAGTSRSVAVPGDGRRIYVTLHSLIGGAYQSNAYYFTAPSLPDAGAAQVTSPSNGSTLTDATLPLTWSSAAGATQYYLFVGGSPGAYDLYIGSQGTSLSRTVTGMPLDGRPAYVTLYSLINGAWKTSSVWFTTANTASGNKRALISSPANETTLPGASATFEWGGGAGVTQYALWIGSSPGAYDLWASAETSTTTSRTVSTLPTDGRKLYVALYSLIGGAWQPASYQYTAANVAITKAAITSPTPGSTLPGASATLTWSASNSATAYALWIGRKPGAYDVYAGAEGTNQSKTVSALPADGGPVYVTLYSLIKGAWQSTEAIYQAAVP